MYSTTALFDELGLLVFVHGAMYMAFAALEEPQSIRSIGLHQTVGDCNATTAVHTPLGQVCTTRCLSVCLSVFLHCSISAATEADLVKSNVSNRTAVVVVQCCDIIGLAAEGASWL